MDPRLENVRKQAALLALAWILACPAITTAAPVDVDRSFGHEGRVITAVGEEAQLSDLAIQRDGKLLAVGSTRGLYFPRIVLVRYLPDGHLDRSFGSGGRVETSLERNSSVSPAAVVLQPGGKAVVAGTFVEEEFEDGDTAWSTFALARYNRDGSLDRSFGEKGTVRTKIGSEGVAEAYALALQRDGKLIAGGVANENEINEFALARYNQDGSLDRSFGRGGRLLTRIGRHGDGEVHALLVQPNRKLVAAGAATNQGLIADGVAIARYMPDGSPDHAFGSGGREVTRIGPEPETEARAMIRQPNGKLVLAGVANVDGRSVRHTLLRYRADGTLDPTFGDDGLRFTSSGAGRSDGASDLVRLGDGKLVTSGTSVAGRRATFALMRFTSTGTLDRGFDLDGKVLTRVASHESLGRALVAQPDGKLVVAGTDKNRFALVRYNSGSPAGRR